MTQFDLMARTDNVISGSDLNKVIASECATSGYASVVPSSNVANTCTIASPTCITWCHDVKQPKEEKDKFLEKLRRYGNGAILADCPQCMHTIVAIPRVKEVETYNDRVVVVRFVDGTWTKAVLSENDTFDIDVGITICMMKRMLGGQKEGTKIYNRYIRSVHKVMKENEKKKADEAEAKRKEREKKRKQEMKLKAKRMKAKEEQIDIVKQGVERALQESDKT